MLKTKYIITIGILIILLSNSFAQHIRLNGYVTDSVTGEVLIGVNVINVNSKKGSVTNNYGYFSLLLDKSSQVKVMFSYIGYTTYYCDFNIKSDTLLSFKLCPSAQQMDEVIVRPTDEKRIEQIAETGKVSIPVAEIKKLPSITGEADILKAFQLLPGIQSGAEINNGLYVRGGSPDQNLVLIDDIPLYNVSHLGGIYSVFDPSMVKSVDLYKGGFPARYGGRISSVVDVRNKDGNFYKYNGELGLSLFLSKIFIEGPIINDKSSFAFSIRRSNLDAYSFLYQQLVSSNYNQGYAFYDLNLKTNIRINQNNRLFISLYNGKDKFYFNEKENESASFKIIQSSYSNLSWGNSALGLRWLHIFSDRVFSNFTLAHTKYNYANKHEFSSEIASDNYMISDKMILASSVQDICIKNDNEIPFHNSMFKFGLIGSQHSYLPSYISYSQSYRSNSIDTTINSPGENLLLHSYELNGYVEFEHKIATKLSSNVGFRAGYYSVGSDMYPTLEPRVVINYLLYPSFSIKTSYCRMHQNIHLLTNSNTGLPSDIWVPSTSILPPEISNQFSLGFAHTYNKKFEVVVDAYIKQLSNLIEYKEGVLLFNSESSWEDKVVKNGEGKIKGIEFLMSRKSGLLTGWIGYTLSSNMRNFEELNSSNDFPYKYDQTHNFSIVGNYKINKNLNLSATWVYHSGNRISLPEKKYQLYNINYYGSYEGEREVYSDIHVYPSRNNYKMPAYHRLDFGLNYEKSKRNGVAIWSFGIYNVYNRQNAYYLFFKNSKNGDTKLYQKSLFPILLNLGYTFRFEGKN